MNDREAEEVLEWALDEINDIIVTVKTLAKLSGYNLHLILLRRLVKKHLKF